jgi:hypothetical protein
MASCAVCGVPCDTSVGLDGQRQPLCGSCLFKIKVWPDQPYPSWVTSLHSTTQHTTIEDLLDAISCNECSVECESCDPAASYCTDCQHWVCDLHGRLHPRKPLTRDHFLLTKAALLKTPTLIWSSPRHPRRCKHHPQEQSTSYCLQCSEWSCGRCQHEGHNNIATATFIGGVRDRVHTVLSRMSAAQEATDRALSATAAHKDVIRLTFTNIHEQLLRYLSSACADLANQMDEKVSAIEERLPLLRGDHARLMLAFWSQDFDGAYKLLTASVPQLDRVEQSMPELESQVQRLQNCFVPDSVLHQVVARLRELLPSVPSSVVPSKGTEFEVKHDTSEPSSSFRVFVGGHLFLADANSVRRHFSACGTIVDVKFPYDPHGKSCGVAMVSFVREEDAERAVYLCSTKQCKPLTRKETGAMEEASTCELLVSHFPQRGLSRNRFHTIFVRSLDFSVMEEELRDAFVGAGQIQRCVVTKDASGESRGFGYVTFTSSESADRAVLDQMEGREVVLRGWPCVVSYDRNTRGGKKGGKGRRGEKQ